MLDNKNRHAVTLLELLVVVLIMGILASVGVTVYTGHVERARIAACRDTIRQIELAVNRYEIDTGQLPPSSSGLTYSPDPLLYEGNSTQGSFGSGYLQMALLHSLNGNVYQPLSNRWIGPYLELDEDQMGDRNGAAVGSSTPISYVQILDAWGMPFYYIKASDYDDLGGTEYASSHPFYATETYYNPSSFQIFSTGRNGSTYAVPYRGEETDDVTNWRRLGRLPGAGGSSGGGSRVNTSSSRSNNDYSGSSSSEGDYTGRRPVKLAFNLLGNSSLLFSWPEGWKKQGDMVYKDSDGEKPVWQFQVSQNYRFDDLVNRYKLVTGAEFLYEGLDPSQTVDNAYVLMVRSEKTPEIKLQNDAKNKPYHLLFAFKEDGKTCWWAANFYSQEAMDKGRLFITGIVRERVPLTSGAR